MGEPARAVEGAIGPCFVVLEGGGTRVIEAGRFVLEC
jgi:hypothetical protein